ncbi:unnamed protein product, partial [Prorocentrum cordatum]
AIQNMIELASTRAAEKTGEASMAQVKEVATTAAKAAAREVLADLDSRMRKLESNPSLAGGASTTGGTVRGDGPYAPSAAERHVPGGVDIKGFVDDWKDPDPSSLTAQAAQRLLHLVSSNLATELNGLIDAPRTTAMLDKKALHTKVTIYLKDRSRGNAWTLKKAIQALADNGTLPNQAAKFYAATETFGMSKTRMKLDYLKIGGSQHIVARRIVGVAHPVKLATFSQAMGWSLSLQNWRDSGCTAEETDIMGAITNA